MTIHLIAAEVFAAARKAVEDGTIQAISNPGGCTYTGPCAIGVAMTQEQRDSLNGDDDLQDIAHLVEKGVFSTDNLGPLMWLQGCHDRLSESVGEDRHSNLYIDPDEAMARFKEVLTCL